MKAPIMVHQGLRIYNLFPLLVGTTAQWTQCLEHITKMGFTHIYLNPITRSGGSGSLYAVADYDALDPRFDDRSGRSGVDQLRSFIETARAQRLGIIFDLVINHTANDAPLTHEHPEWYRRDAAGKIEAPYAVDTSAPDDVSKRTVWGDLAELSYDERPEREAMLEYFKGVIERALALGIVGFRCDAAYKVPGAVWKQLIDAAKKQFPQTIFLAETLGAPIEEITQLAEAGFDAFFSSAKWWDFQSPWLLEQYEQFRHIAPSIAFPESHDTMRLAEEIGGAPESLEGVYRLRYGFSAFFASGVMIPSGYEFGARKALNVVNSTPADQEAPSFDLTQYIAAMNTVKAQHPALNEEGPQRRVDTGWDGPLVLERRTNKGDSPVFAAINAGNATLYVARKYFGVVSQEITPDHHGFADTHDMYELPPQTLRIFT